jgi:hypothetical protein
VRSTANSSLTDDDSSFSDRSSVDVYENSGIPSTEYDATAKSDAVLAIIACLSCSLLAGIFQSNDAVASNGRTDDNVMPVLKERIGWPFHSDILLLASLRAAMVLASNSMTLSHGFLCRRDYCHCNGG